MQSSFGNFFSISFKGKLRIFRFSNVVLNAECKEEFDNAASSYFFKIV